MKTLKKNDQIIRVKESEVNNYLSMGYSYTPKSIWKKNIRDINKDSKMDKKDKKSK